LQDLFGNKSHFMLVQYRSVCPIMILFRFVTIGVISLLAVNGDIPSWWTAIVSDILGVTTCQSYCV